VPRPIHCSSERKVGLRMLRRRATLGDMRKKPANCSLRNQLFLLLAIAALQSITLSAAFGEDSTATDGGLSFCGFGPKVTVVPSAAHHSPDSCVDRVHVQGVLWKCGSSEDVTTRRSDFLIQINTAAREECKKHCESLGANCRAIYSSVPICGLGTDRETAVALGKQYGCRKDCNDGTAFTYCSIFNAGFQGKGIEAIQADPPNCECRSQ
jgi:hypothetical protein